MSWFLFGIVASCGWPVWPYQPILCYISLLSHSLHQSFPTFQTPLTPWGESNPESHFIHRHSEISHIKKEVYSLTLRHALEVQLPFFFFFLHLPIYSNTLWGTFIKVGRACGGSGIGNVRYQMIFIASSPRAISTPLTWCQHQRFILEAICTWLNCSAKSSIVTAFNAK